MLTISARDINSGLAKVVVEKKTSNDAEGDITTKKVEEYTYNGTRKQQKIEIKLSVSYQEYLRGYKVTATDGKNNETVSEKDNIKIQGNEYIITNKEELQEFATKVNEGNTFQGITIELENNINLSNWTPIGNKSRQFKGTFKGNGHTISNMQILDRSEAYTGLFGYLGEGGSIENVKIKDCNITGNGEYIGGLVGYSRFIWG